MKASWLQMDRFRKALYGWVALYIVVCLPGMKWLWIDPVAPHIAAQPSLIDLIPQEWSSPIVMGMTLCVLITCCVLALLGKGTWWMRALTWTLFVGLSDLAWLANSGGQHLIANFLFWGIFLFRSTGTSTVKANVTVISFWAIRLQLLMVYFTTSLHKLTGITWLSGDALGIVVTDPAYGPSFLAEAPVLLTLLTWITLVFQLLFPVLIWSKRVRPYLLLFGAVFHLLTGVFLGIPDMALAFLVGYVAWWEGGAVLLSRRKTEKALA